MQLFLTVYMTYSSTLQPTICTGNLSSINNNNIRKRFEHKHLKCIACQWWRLLLYFAEHEQITMNKHKGQLLTWEDLAKMSYTWRIAQGLRIFPPVFGCFRQALKDKRIQWIPYSLRVLFFSFLLSCTTFIETLHLWYLDILGNKYDPHRRQHTSRTVMVWSNQIREPSFNSTLLIYSTRRWPSDMSRIRVRKDWNPSYNPSPRHSIYMEVFGR